MSKRNNTIILIFVLLLGFFSLNLAFPQYLNKGIDFLQPKVKNIPLLRLLPNLPERSFRLGLDLKGGSRLVYQADLTTVEKAGQAEAMQGLRDVIERRVNLFGVGEPQVMLQQVGESRRLIVELPGVYDIAKAIEMIGKTPFLEFKEELSAEERLSAIKGQMGPNAPASEDIPQACSMAQFVSAFIQEYQQDPCYKATGLTGQYLKTASLSFGQTGVSSEVILEFNDQGKEIFKTITERNVNKQIAIFIDNILLSAPKVNEAIPGGTARITGDFTVDEAKELVRNLNAGALPVPIKLVEQTTVGPTLGSASLEKSLVAGISGFLFVALFMLVFYRLGGFLADVALLIYLGVFLCLFKFIPVTLTLAGIGGAVLSIGMAVDANVLVFERLREELRAGQDFKKAVETGFKRAWPSIRDSNLTTILVGVIMFSFGSSFVKGFALTLNIGVVLSMFFALFATRIFLRMFAKTRWEKVRWLWG